MSLGTSILKFIRKLFSKIFGFIKTVLKKLWPILLIVGVIYFAPLMTSWLTTAGAPSWLISATSALSAATPAVTSVVNWLGSGVASLASSAGSWYGSLGMGTQLALLAGTAAAIAPEEFTDVVTDAAVLAGDVIGTVGGALVDSVVASPVGVAAIAGGLFLLMSSRREKNQ